MMHTVLFQPYLEPNQGRRIDMERWCRMNLEHGSWITGYKRVDDDNCTSAFYYAFFRKQDEVMFRMVWG